MCFGRWLYKFPDYIFLLAVIIQIPSTSAFASSDIGGFPACPNTLDGEAYTWASDTCNNGVAIATEYATINFNTKQL